MDHTTRTALRAIIHGLETVGIVNEQAIGSIVEQLRRAAGSEADYDRQEESEEIRELADDIEADARLD